MFVFRSGTDSRIMLMCEVHWFDLLDFKGFFSFLLDNRYKRLALKLHFGLFWLLFLVFSKCSKDSCCLCSQYRPSPFLLLWNCWMPQEVLRGTQRSPRLQGSVGCCPRSGACWGLSAQQRWEKKEQSHPYACSLWKIWWSTFSSLASLPAAPSLHHLRELNTFFLAFQLWLTGRAWQAFPSPLPATSWSLWLPCADSRCLPLQQALGAGEPSPSL